MPKFSEFFSLNQSQYELDFVDINNRRDTPVYVDPYAIEVADDIWAATASEYIRGFFKEVLDALRANNIPRAAFLMSNLHEPSETFLGVSREEPRGRGVGAGQAQQLLRAIQKSKAFRSGILSDLSEMSLYVEGVARDKISDLTTNILRGLLAEYTRQQCELHAIPIGPYSGPPLWNASKQSWVSKQIMLPRIEDMPVLLVPKYIVRRNLSLESQEFYNKQITDFLVAEHLKANDSLVHILKTTNERKVYKGDVRDRHPMSKKFIADMVIAHPELLEMYKGLAKTHKSLIVFEEEAPSLTSVCANLASVFSTIPKGPAYATKYHDLVLGALTALFHPDLIQPRKEWEIHDGRKRIDIVITNAGDKGFFAQRRDDPRTGANVVIVECKNYSNDIANKEIDQLIGRFDVNRGKFGIITCRGVEDDKLLLRRCQDAAVRQQGYIITLTDHDIVDMLNARAELKDELVEQRLFEKFRMLLA
ncbi:MAG: hypothetical protein WBO09_05080 [Methylocystis silviterrae]|uniref:hypothetical protein n=1 Tax=Methylocystis silviterrae TaxID=2743612 RepID=UPI003C74E630